MLGVDMATEREEYEVRIRRPYDLQHQFFPASQTRIDLSVEFFTSFAGIQRAKYVPRHAPRAKRLASARHHSAATITSATEVVSLHEFAKTRGCVFVAPGCEALRIKEKARAWRRVRRLQSARLYQRSD
jgi:hypothetical protein